MLPRADEMHARGQFTGSRRRTRISTVVAVCESTHPRLAKTAKDDYLFLPSKPRKSAKFVGEMCAFESFPVVTPRGRFQGYFFAFFFAGGASVLILSASISALHFSRAAIFSALRSASSSLADFSSSGSGRALYTGNATDSLVFM